MKTTGAKKMVGILTAAFLVGISTTAAFAALAIDPAMNTWKTTGSCKGCNLAGKTIPVPTKSDGTKTLENANLTNAIFEAGVDLAGYNLVNASFSGATFAGNSLKGSKIDRANFQGAKFFKNKANNKQCDLTEMGLLDPNSVQVIEFSSSDLSEAIKPGRFPNPVHLGKSKWTNNDVCDDQISKSGCKKLQKCPNPHSGYLAPDGVCAD